MELTLKIIEFNDYILPNIALDDGDIDLNSYQHLPFLEDQVTNRGYNSPVLAKYFTANFYLFQKTSVH